jgi:hypothetical protein
MLHRSIYNIENGVQASGRCAREHGQQGEARVFTWNRALEEEEGSEFAQFARNPATFSDSCYQLLDSQVRQRHDQRPEDVQPVLNWNLLTQAMRVLRAPGTWKLPPVSFQCWICGEPHVAKNCPYKGKDDVPKGYCYCCLLQTWKMDGKNSKPSKA